MKQPTKKEPADTFILFTRDKEMKKKKKEASQEAWKERTRTTSAADATEFRVFGVLK